MMAVEFEQRQDVYEAANPMGRLGDPEADIGGVALFLASDDARFVTGESILVDGGLTAS